MERKKNRIARIFPSVFLCLAVLAIAIVVVSRPPIGSEVRAAQSDAGPAIVEEELRSLLQKKVTLLREAIAKIRHAADMGLETSAHTDAASLMNQCVLAELELCRTREERLRITTKNAKEMDDLLRQAEAEHRAGRMPGFRLTELRIFQLDARILEAREKLDADTK
jgi:hypothetical protein